MEPMKQNSFLAKIHGVRKRLRSRSAGLLVVRLATGGVFFNDGLQKLQHTAAIIKFFASLGFSPFWAHVVSWVETLGGAALILGICTSAAGVALAIDMSVVIFHVKWAHGFATYQLELMLGSSALALAFMGSGRYSLARLFFQHDCDTCADCMASKHCRDCK
jgi:putative oxidoreductase